MYTPSGIIVAMDEAGRGSWAGPVVAAAIIMPKGLRLKGLTDSKLLSAQQRDFFYEKLIKTCEYGVGVSSHEEVDQFGLLHATYKAFSQALNSLKTKADHILIDGRDNFVFEIPHTSIIKGDLKVRAISAASVIAKVTRDRLMIDYAKVYPEYAFEEHKGYGTERHQNALKNYGPCAIHRKSYTPIMNLLCRQETLL
jgi:ribonuclease HII